MNANFLFKEFSGPIRISDSLKVSDVQVEVPRDVYRLITKPIREAYIEFKS